MISQRHGIEPDCSLHCWTPGRLSPLRSTTLWYVILSSYPASVSPRSSLFGADLKKMPSSTRILPGILSKQNYRFSDMASIFITNMKERAKMAGNEQLHRRIYHVHGRDGEDECDILTAQNQFLVKQDWHASFALFNRHCWRVTATMFLSPTAQLHQGPFARHSITSIRPLWRPSSTRPDTWAMLAGPYQRNALAMSQPVYPSMDLPLIAARLVLKADYDNDNGTIHKFLVTDKELVHLAHEGADIVIPMSPRGCNGILPRNFRRPFDIYWRGVGGSPKITRLWRKDALGNLEREKPTALAAYPQSVRPRYPSGCP
ncbi:unnamed protein product [Fusarium venenatum]|uniref:Uncharacterized protein n=1 Tax=Fusarium venenatum TaxID=56646 RepID=A0A2L2T8G5_9HYPO|nr:uncharacterized protein FVRRES_04933 [Fusarium venenatum]CEI60497.1 unnamed protein product [Fusarium venenatum]